MKKSLREILLKKRDGIKPEQKKVKEEAIKKRLFALDDFKKAKSILFYASFRSEVDTMRCLQDVVRQEKKLVLPLVDRKKRKIRLYKIKDVSELVSGCMGIPEPGIIKDREMSLKDIDVAIIPGAGFDVKGNRLGYGAGYYDRLLSYESQRLSKSKGCITTIALAFEEQIIEEIPAEFHDIKVDKIITDKRVIYCRDTVNVCL